MQQSINSNLGKHQSYQNNGSLKSSSSAKTKQIPKLVGTKLRKVWLRLQSLAWLTSIILWFIKWIKRATVYHGNSTQRKFSCTIKVPILTLFLTQITLLIDWFLTKIKLSMKNKNSLAKKFSPTVWDDHRQSFRYAPQPSPTAAILSHD